MNASPEGGERAGLDVTRPSGIVAGTYVKSVDTLACHLVIQAHRTVGFGSD